MPNLNNLKGGDVVFVRANFVPHRNRRVLTRDKIYVCTLTDNWSGELIGDAGQLCYILLESCAFLDESDWEVLSEKIAKYYDRFGRLPPKELEPILCQK